MKLPIALMLAALSGLWLAACGALVATPTQPSIAAGALDTADAYLLRGDQYAGLKDYDHAIADYSQAIRLKPDYAEAYNNRGFAYSLTGKAVMALAIADYSQAILLRPGYAYAHNNRGVAYMASGHPDEAMQDFNRAIQLQPDLPQAYSNRGNAYYRQGRYDLAIFDFIRADTIPLLVLALVLGVMLALVLLGARLTHHRIRRRSAVRRSHV